MSEQFENESAESLVFDSSESDSQLSSNINDENISSSSDNSSIHPVGLTASRRRRISSSESTVLQNLDREEDPVDTNEEKWEEVFEDSDNSPEDYKFEEIPGPKHTLPLTAAPIAYFYLFFTNSLLDTIVKETNAYASNFLTSRTNLSLHSRLRKWTPITIPELKAFIACLINMGINKRPSIASYWFTNNSQHLPWFHQMFSRNRFQLILKFFHIADTENLPPPGRPGYDPCAKIQPLIEHANTLFRLYYTPHQQLSIDESLVGTKNHTQLLQYLPNKHHHRWGIKFWMLCDSVANYCLAFFIYRGARSNIDKSEIKKNGLAYTVVMQLLKMGNYLSKGYHIFMDNFFTSIPLAKNLYGLGTYITGTIRRNRKCLPKKLTERFAVAETKYFRQGPILTVGFREKKSQRFPVLLLSTKAKAESSTHFHIHRVHNTETVKPSVIQSYNNYMGGIDTSDMMLYTYLDERRTVKYWKKICFNIFSRMILNSYIIYKESLPSEKKPISRLNFIINIVEHLGSEWLLEKNNKSTVESIELLKLPGKKEKECCVCSKRRKFDGGKRRRSRTICSKCEKGLHSECFPKHKCYIGNIMSQH